MATKATNSPILIDNNVMNKLWTGSLTVLKQHIDFERSVGERVT